MSQAAIRRFGTLTTVRDFDDYLDYESTGRLRAVLRGGDPVQVPVAVLRTLSDADSPPLFLATGPAPVAATHACTLIRALRVDWSDSLEAILAEAFRLTRRRPASSGSSFPGRRLGNWLAPRTDR